MVPFCHCHAHSRHSFYDGLNPVEELVEKAAWLGQPGIALTDHGVLYGAPGLFKACHDHGLKGMIGMEAYEAVPHQFDMERDGGIFKIKWDDLNGRDRYYHLTLWVLNDTGWRNLCALHTESTTGRYFATQRGKPLLDRASLERHSEGLAVGLGCMASRTNVTLARHGHDLDRAYEAARWYSEVFPGRVYVEVMGNLPEQQALIRGQRKLARKLGADVIGTNDVHYRDKVDGAENGPHHLLVQGRRFRSKDIEQSGDRSDAGFGQWYGSDGFYLKTADDMLRTGGIERQDLENTIKLLDSVSFDFDQLPRPQPPLAPIPAAGENPAYDAYLLGRSFHAP